MGEPLSIAGLPKSATNNAWSSPTPENSKAHDGQPRQQQLLSNPMEILAKEITGGALKSEASATDLESRKLVIVCVCGSGYQCSCRVEEATPHSRIDDSSWRAPIAQSASQIMVIPRTSLLLATFTISI